MIFAEQGSVTPNTFSIFEFSRETFNKKRILSDWVELFDQIGFDFTHTGEDAAEIRNKEDNYKCLNNEREAVNGRMK